MLVGPFFVKKAIYDWMVSKMAHRNELKLAFVEMGSLFLVKAISDLPEAS